MTSSSHYHYNKKDDDDDEFETMVEEFLEIPYNIPEPKKRKKKNFYQEKPRRRSHETLELLF